VIPEANPAPCGRVIGISASCLAGIWIFREVHTTRVGSMAVKRGIYGSAVQTQAFKLIVKQSVRALKKLHAEYNIMRQMIHHEKVGRECTPTDFEVRVNFADGAKGCATGGY